MISRTSLFSANNNPNVSFKSTLNNSKEQHSEQINHNNVKNAPVLALKAYSGIGFSGRADRVTLKLLNAPSVEALTKKFGKYVIRDIGNLKERIGKSGQYLNWIGILQKDQLKRVDTIYKLAASIKKQGGDGKLGIIGIGGSKHTVENVLGLTGLTGKVEMFSGTDPVSIKDFIQRLGDLSKANIAVVSKSGGTLEPNHGFKQVKKALIEAHTHRIAQEKQISFPEAKKQAVQEVKKHITVITDKDPAKSQLRKLANEKGYLSGIIHDDCGGRFGAFDDHALVALAYSGMPKSDMRRMLEASLKIQEKFMSTDLSKNLAAQKAMFNVEQVLNGKTSHYNYMFGDRFEGATKWNTQLKRESIKAEYDHTDAVGPAFLHYAAEADLDAKNTRAFYTFVSVDNKKSDYKTYRAINNGVEAAYSGQHPTAQIKLKDYTPEDIAEFIELKHMETIHTGMLLRSARGIEHPPISEAIPEVLQPNVEIYKKEVKKAQATA